MQVRLIGSDIICIFSWLCSSTGQGVAGLQQFKEELHSDACR
jgi:hypothetical protein